MFTRDDAVRLAERLQQPGRCAGRGRGGGRAGQRRREAQPRGVAPGASEPTRQRACPSALTVCQSLRRRSARHGKLRRGVAGPCRLLPGVGGPPGPWSTHPLVSPVLGSGQARDAAEGHRGAAGPGTVRQPVRPLAHGPHGVCRLPGWQGGFLPGEPRRQGRGGGPPGFRPAATPSHNRRGVLRFWSMSRTSPTRRLWISFLSVYALCSL